ncbi:MAG: hypothetical protein JSS75_10620 [Bacteroidetes bacterium]|nr:hypothetical protein [Bacteroidota bacterium]
MTIRISTLRALLGAALVASVIGCGKHEYSGPVNAFRRYEIKNVHMQYEFLGNARGGEEMFIADYGRYEARYSKYELLGEQGIQPVGSAGITRLADVYNISLNERKVVHLKPPELDSLYHLSESEIPTPAQFLEKSMHNNLMRAVGTDTIAGVPATRWENRDGSGKFWIWRGILMKKITQTRDGMIGTQLVALDTAWAVDTTKFSLPKTGFQFIEQSEKK